MKIGTILCASLANVNRLIFSKNTATFFFSILLYMEGKTRLLLVNTRSSRVLKHLTDVYYTNL